MLKLFNLIAAVYVISSCVQNPVNWLHITETPNVAKVKQINCIRNHLNQFTQRKG